ncbi:MAG: hypothetical protein H6711_26920 [Myxococcales bacterium]|nr:hypothetical protein [Myxococcales bacterium]
MHINGLQLPACIAVLLQAERWVAPDPETLQRVMGDVPVHPIFYHYSLMQSENSHWLEEKRLEYVGVADGSGGVIDPAKSVLIGDLGPDRLVALDYGRGYPPRVVYLGHGSSSWVEIAEDAESLLRRLGLG